MSLMINGKAYDWSDVTVRFPDFEMQVQEISYDDELEKDLVYGTGAKPRGYGTGNYKGSFKVSVLLDDYEQFLAYCKKKGTTPYKVVIPKIIVSFANDGQKTHTDVLNLATFSKMSHKAASGDKSLKVDLDGILAGTIERDGVAAL